MNHNQSGLLILTILSTVTSVFLAPNAFSEENPSRATSMFNERWLDAVVSVEQAKPVRKPDGSTEIVTNPIGTGFLIETENKHLALVTAKHVVSELIEGEQGLPELRTRKGLRYRLNQNEGSAYLIEDQELQEGGLGGWFVAEGNDVALRFLKWKEKTRFARIRDVDFIPRKDLRVGASLLILGFPLGLRSSEHPSPIARKGMVARSDQNTLIADALIFPGNSGGPVIYTPPIKIGGGMTSPFINEERLAGLAISYEPYREFAESTQTRKSRVVFEENSGLANIEPADIILRLLQRADVKAMDSKIH